MFLPLTVVAHLPPSCNLYLFDIHHKQLGKHLNSP